MASELLKRLLQSEAEPLVRQINNMCTMSALTKLETHLPNELNEIKRDPVFGPILKIDENSLGYSARTIHSFLCRQLVTDKKHEMWFVFARRPLRFSLQEFHAVTSLKVASDEDEDVNLESWDDDGGFWSRLLKRDEPISLEKIWTDHISVANKWTREDRLRLAYICVIAGVVMARGDSAIIPREWIILAMDMRKLHSYRWGLKAYDLLLESLFRVRDKFLTVEESKRKSSYVLYGFSYAFQIWIMEAIPVVGQMLGKKLNEKTNEGPRCSNWKGFGRVSYAEVNSLEEAFLPQDIVYPYISITGNGDVVQSVDFVYVKENADARVDNMTLLCRREHDWSGHIWEVEVRSPADEDEEPNVEQQDVSVPTPTTRKRRLPDHGAEERKRRLLFERSAQKQGQCNEEMKQFLKEMFEASFSSWEARLWTKIDGRLSNMEHQMAQIIKDSVNTLAATTSIDDPLTPSDPTPVDTAKPKRVDVRVNLWDNLYEVPLSQSQNEDIDKNLGTQEYLNKTMDGLSQDSYVADVDPTQNLMPKDSVDWKTPSTSFKSARGDISEPQSSNIDDSLDWLPPPPTSDKKILASKGKSKVKSNVKTSFIIPRLSDSTTQTPERALDRLCDISDDGFEKLTAWSSNPTELQLGPVKFDVGMANRIIGRHSWIRNDEIDATMFLFRERTSLRRWEPDRMGFMSCGFGTQIHAAHQRYLAEKKSFKLDQLLLMYGKGELPSHGRTNQVWGVDVDVVYIPLFVNQNHWIAMRVSFLEKKVEVFDCGGGKNRRHAEKFALLIPRIVRAVHPTGDKNQLSIQQYSIVDVPVRRRLNKNNSDCGVYALKFIECNVLGLDMEDIDDMTIGGARLRLAYELWIAAQDPELIERMLKYESPEFEPGPVVEFD